jgi:Flp pilus assembly protein TadG
MKQNYTIPKAASVMRSGMRSLRLFVTRRGQAAVEFALVATVAMIVLFVAVQLALIGEDALALGQMNYQGARWAAVNTCARDTEIANYIVSVGSPSVAKSGGTCGTQLTIAITDSSVGGAPTTRPGIKGTACTNPPPSPTACSAGANQRPFGTPVTINLSFDATKAIFLYGAGGATNKPWMGLINLPTTLTSTETAMAE